MRKIFIFAILTLCSLNCALASDKDIVAMVNGQPITKYQLDNRAKLVINTQNITFNSSAQRDAFDKRVIEELIEEELVRKAGQDFEIEVKEEMVNSAIKSIEKQNGLPENYMLALLQEHGLSVESYKNKISSEILRGKIFSILASDITVTEAEARNLLLNSKEAEPKIHIWVFSSRNHNNNSTDLQQMENLRRNLAKSDLTKLSLAQDNEFADSEEFFDYSKLSPRTKSALQDTNKGALSKVYQDGSKYRLIAVLEKDVMDDKKTSNIKNNLKIQKAERKYHFFLKGLRSKADIVIK